MRGPRPDGKERRLKEVQERQAEYDKLSLEQKLETLAHKPGACKRQRARLLKAIEAQKTQASIKIENQLQKFMTKQATSKK